MASTQVAFPFPYRRSPEFDRAYRHGLAWARDVGMVNSERAAGYWKSGNFAEFACLYWPYAVGADVELAVDAMTFYFFFDDQFDTELGHDIGEVMGIQDELAAITRTNGTTNSRAPVMVAFADIWRRAIEGMSSQWRQRAGRHWRQYFSGHIAEAIDRQCNTAHRRDTYWALRRWTVGAETSTDLCERLGHFEVPEDALAWPQLRVMRQLCCDVMAIGNDLNSYEKEMAHGEVNNIVSVTCHEQQLSLEGALAKVREEARRMIGRFLQIEQELSRICEVANPAYREIIATYVEALKAGMSGGNQWGNETARYNSETSPDVALSYVEELTKGPSQGCKL